MHDATTTLTRSEDFSDDVIRSFLLGRLGSIKQTEIEGRLMIDDGLEERVRLAEFQLTDDYILERLDLNDRHRFLGNFLVTRERRRLLMVSTVLRDRFWPASRAGSRPGILSSFSWKRVFDFNRPAWRYAFGVVILLILFGSVLLVTKESRIVNRFFPKRLPARPAAVSTPMEANHPTESTGPVHRETPSPLPAHESTMPGPAVNSQVIATLLLSPGINGEISLPGQVAGVVRLQLSVEENDSRGFRAELLTVGNHTVFVTEEIKPDEGGHLNFDVPAQNLMAGDYQVKLSRVHDGSEKPLASYSFRVR